MKKTSVIFTTIIIHFFIAVSMISTVQPVSADTGSRYLNNATPYAVDLSTAGIFWQENLPENYPALSQMLSDSGVRWVRVNAVWEWLEQENDLWNEELLEKMRLLLVALREKNLNIVFLVSRTPAWASSAPPEDDIKVRYPPADIIYWNDVIEEMVYRYGNLVQAWEIENEVGHKLGFVQQKEFYVLMVQRAHDIIKSDYPDTKIILSPFWLPPPINHIDPTLSIAAIKYWLTQTESIVDIYNIHSYTPDENQLTAIIEDFRGYISDAGVVEKPIWLTETNFCLTHEEACADPWMGGDRLKSRYRTALVSGVDKIFWHKVRHDGYWGPGLLNMDYDSTVTTYSPHEPIYGAYQQMSIYISDANGDGLIDFSDLSFWITNYGQQKLYGIAEGDFDNNGKVNSADFCLWLLDTNN